MTTPPSQTQGEMPGEKIRSGSFCECKACGHQGRAYGALTSEGGYAPWSANCGRNNRLILIASAEEQTP